MIDDQFDLSTYIDLLKECLRRIICIEHISIITIHDDEATLATNLELKHGLDIKSEFIREEMKKLSDQLEFDKLVNISKQAFKYPYLGEILMMNESNFCYKAKQQSINGQKIQLYLFHFDFQSIKTLLEK